MLDGVNDQRGGSRWGGRGGFAERLDAPQSPNGQDAEQQQLMKTLLFNAFAKSRKNQSSPGGRGGASS